MNADSARGGAGMNDDGRGRDSGDGNHAAVGTESDGMRRRLRRPFGFGAAAGRIGTTLPPAGAAAFAVAAFAGAGFATAALPAAGFAFATGFGLTELFGTSLSFGFFAGGAGLRATAFFGATFLKGFEGRTGFFATDFRTAAAARLTVIFGFLTALAAGFAFEAGFRFGRAFTLEVFFFEGVTLPEGFLAPPVFFPFTGMAILAGPEVYP